jgi:hypothetical protein
LGVGSFPSSDVWLLFVTMTRTEKFISKTFTSLGEVDLLLFWALNAVWL